MGDVKEATKVRLLSQLRARIINELFVDQWMEVWFFPQWGGVRGWKGTQDIIFVGLNPSSGRFPSLADRLFYEQLRSNRFENAHLTDMIKVRAVGGMVGQMLGDAALMKQQRVYLLEEIDIIQPRLIVPMGRRTAAILGEWVPNRSEICPIRHYSPRIPSAQNFGKFSAELDGVGARYGGA